MRRARRVAWLAALAVAAAISAPAGAWGQEGDDDDDDASRRPAYGVLPLDLPLLDLPENRQSAAWPSMRQALRFSQSAHQALHWGLGHKVDPWPGSKAPFTGIAAFAVTDLLFMYLPLGDGWVHEEFHRAVMGVRGVSSYDEIYDLPIGAELVAVSHEKDAELARLKRDHPADMVRLPAAGIEGQAQLTLALERDAFYRDARNYHLILYWMSAFNIQGYVSSGATSEADDMTEAMNAEEDTVEERDFVGHDFTSWVYDLHRPDEPYEDRGIHRSGVGVDRYRSPEDLTDGEMHYLKTMGNLAYLNFVDPNLVGVSGFDLPDGSRLNGTLQHYLTSFGYAHAANVFYLSPAKRGVFATLYNYRNRDTSHFGLSVELDRWWTGLAAPLPTQASVRAHAWRQPRAQRYDAQTSRPGALGEVRLSWLDARAHAGTVWSPYLELEGKSAGWVAGNPYLDKAGAVRLGVEALIR